MLAVWLTVAYIAAQGPRQNWDSPLIWSFLALAAVIALGGLILTLASRWRKAPEHTDVTGEQLADFRELYERGELSAEEFERIKERLNRQLRQGLGLAGAATPVRPETPAGSPPPPGPTAADS